MVKSGLERSIYIALVLFVLPVIFSVDFGTVHLSGVASAQEGEGGPPRKTKKTPTLRKAVYEKLNEAQLLMETEPPNFQGAKQLVNEVQRIKDLEPYELAQLYNFYAYLHYTQGNTGQAIKSYEQVLAQPELPEAMTTQTIYTLAQLYFANEQYQQSIKMLDRWFANAINPGPDPYILLGQAYYQVGDFKKALVPVETAIRLAKENNKPVRENWLLLLRVFYYELNDYPKVVQVLEELLQQWPKKEYWVQLAGMYGELDKSPQQAAAYDLAYRQGLLTQERELVQMAQLYMSQDVPYLAAKVLTEGMDAGAIARNGKNVRLLSQAWAMAQEDDKAIPALQEAARLTGDADLYVRLAQSYINLQDWDKAVEALQTALSRGGVKRPDQARVMLGMAQFNLNQLKAAEDTFRLAAQDSRSSKTARQWIQYIRAERDRKAELRRALQ